MGHIDLEPELKYVAACEEDINFDDLGTERDFYLCVTSDGEVYRVRGDAPSADRYVDSREELEQVRLKILAEREEPKVYQAVEFDTTCCLIIPDFETISLELMAYCAKHPDMLADMQWRKFEELLDAIFKNQGYYTELGPGSGDGGVDIRLIQKDSIGEVLTLVQAKRYKSQNPIGLEAVQALHGVVADERAHRGLFVTTSRYLPGAQQFATRQNQRLVLADSQHVADWCRHIVNSKKA